MTTTVAKLPRLLAGCAAGAAMDIDQHLAIHGELRVADHARSDREHAIVAEIERAGLKGHGGAAFPTATKLGAVLRAGGRPVVLVNGCEGEPISRKDHLLLARLPHLVLDGALVLARALRSREIVVAVERDAVASQHAMDRAIAGRREFTRRGLTARVVPVAPGYVSGQETAVINVVNGRPGIPYVTPPYPVEAGIGRRPTLVNNAETLAHVALIARHGADWYREIGTREQPGSRLVTLDGAIRRPGVMEIENGTSLHTLVKVAGGVSEPVQAFLLGGYAGAWVGADATAVSVDDAGLRKRGATLGAGIIFALPQSACPVAEVARVARWLANNRASQCGPCTHGLDAIAASLAELADVGDASHSYGHLKRWCRLITGRGACAMPDGAARFIRSALQQFAAEFDDHARYGRCDDCSRPPVLPTPVVRHLVAR